MVGKEAQRIKRGENPEDAPKKQTRVETVEELIKLAEKYSITLTEEEAAKLLRLMHPTARELGESELDAVTGGTLTGPGMCPHCGAWFDWTQADDFYVCLGCGYRQGTKEGPSTDR